MTTGDWTIAVAAVASVGAWVAVLVRRTPGKELLAYEPRLRVPWNGAAGMIAVLFVALAVAASTATPQVADTPPTPPSPGESLLDAAGNTLFVLALIGFGAAMIVSGGALLRDLGLPTSWDQAGKDTRLGLLVALLSLAPVYFVFQLTRLVQSTEEAHPTLDALASNPSLAGLLAAVLLAGFAMPLFEEFLFRLLFQGWLEKVEDGALAWGATARPSDMARDADTVGADPDLQATRPTEGRGVGAPVWPAAESVDDTQRRSLASFTGLPHGWAPILGSATLFALAHLDVYALPAPLLVLAVLLGYVYQRTHRIVPCFVAHAAFNLFSLFVTFAAVWTTR
ncbi:MAG: CPBP family intramembrane glutamic endopeptidase [Planctomycetota bacterium]